MRLPSDVPVKKLLALASRIDDVPAYSGADLKAPLYCKGRAATTAVPVTKVILIEAKWRKHLAAALRAYVEIKRRD